MSDKINEIASGMFSLSKMREAPWNSNVMPAEEYARLGEDMKRGGPDAISRVLLAHARCIHGFSDASDDEYVVIDGNHRVRKARELGWTSIRGELDFSIDDEEKARTTGYLKNTERGSQDPYKLAEYFSWFSETKKMTHEEIAKIHGIDRTTVTKTLSLLKIAPEVKEKLADVPYVTISHLEPIAAAPHHVQREVIKHVSKREHSTVAQIAQCVRTITQEHEKRERLRKAAATAKFPKCPKCGKAPDDFDWTYDGKKNEDNVRCENWHRWSLSKGVERERSKPGEPSEPTIPQSIKSERVMDDFRAAFNVAISELLPTITDITDIDINSSGKIADIHITGQAGGKIRQVVTAMLPSVGKIEHIRVEGRTRAKKKISLSVTLYDWSLEFKLERQGGRDYNLKINKAEIKDHPEIKTRVSLVGHNDRIASKEDLSKLERQVQDLFREYGVKG